MTKVHLDEGQEIFRGHLEECLQHYGQRLFAIAPKGLNGAMKIRKPIADFCGVEPETVSRWFREPDASPVGEALLKMMCYLDAIGYRVIELERMPNVVRNFAELIGYSLISTAEAIDLLGYAKASTLHQVLQGHHGTSSEKEAKMWDAWKARKDAVEPAKARVKAENPIGNALRQASLLPEVAPATMASKRMIVFICELRALQALLDDGPLTESNLAELRPSADTIMRLSVRLSEIGAQLIVPRRKGGG